MSFKEQLPRLNAAAQDMLNYLVASYRQNDDLPTETLVGAAAALTGEHILRATHALDTPSDTGWIDNPAADALLYASPNAVTIYALVNLFADIAEADRIDMPRLVARIDDGVGKAPFPPLSIPDEHYPDEWSPNAAVIHREAIIGIGADHKLSDYDRAIALGITVAKAINLVAPVLDKNLSALLAFEIMTGTTRLRPMDAPI